MFISPSKLRGAFAGIAACTVLASTCALAAPVAAPRDRGFYYTSFSYGTRVVAGSALKSGPSAIAGIGCTSDAPLSRTNTSAGLTDATAVTSSSVATTAETKRNPLAATSTSTVHGVDLFGGIVTATMVRAVSTTIRTGSAFTVSQEGTMFEGLVVRGQKLQRNVAPNTREALPGVGYVVIDQVTKKMSASSASLIVEAFHVVVTQSNGFGVTPNSNVLVGQAMSGLNGPMSATLGGESYGSWVNRNKSVTSGPAIRQLMPCLGTNGKLLVDSAAQLERSGALTGGTARNTADGTVGPRTAVGTLTSTVQNVDLLAGVVAATHVIAVARVEKRGNRVLGSASGSGFGTLEILGVPEKSPNIPVDTKMAIPGLGTLYLHRVLRTARSIEVRMIELVVTQSNRYGLPIGSDIRIGVAVARAS